MVLQEYRSKNIEIIYKEKEAMANVQFTSGKPYNRLQVLLRHINEP